MPTLSAAVAAAAEAAAAAVAVAVVVVEVAVAVVVVEVTAAAAEGVPSELEGADGGLAHKFPNLSKNKGALAPACCCC